MTFDIVFAATAIDDLAQIFDFIEANAGADVADTYLARIEAACAKLDHFPLRGTPRDDLVPGLRTIVFERRATIAYTVSATTVTIQRVLHHGRDFSTTFITES